MKQIKIIIERSKDAYCAFAENAEGVTGMGHTAEEAKKEALEGLKIQQELGNIKPGKYDIVYQYDMQSLLNYYKGLLTLASLERITGVDQKYLQHYAAGLKRPRPERRKKIETSLRRFGQELMALEL